MPRCPRLTLVRLRAPPGSLAPAPIYLIRRVRPAQNELVVFSVKQDEGGDRKGRRTGGETVLKGRKERSCRGNGLEKIRNQRGGGIATIVTGSARRTIGGRKRRRQ